MTIRHVVLFEPLETASDDDLNTLVNTLRSFSAIPGVSHLAAGLDFSLRSEYRVSFTCDFESTDALQAYLDHPDHQAVVTGYLPTVVKQGWKVVDFEF